MHRYTHTQTYTQRKANTYSQFQSLYSVTCFVSIYKRFARPSQCLFLCTSLSCRALQSSTRLRRGASATRHQPVSQLPSGTLAALQVFAGEIRASANSSSSDLGVLRTRTSAAEEAPYEGDASGTNQPVDCLLGPSRHCMCWRGALRAPANKSSSDLPL